MNTEKNLSDEQKLTVHQQMVIADSPSGGEPQPLVKKTPDEEKRFMLAVTDWFYFHL